MEQMALDDFISKTLNGIISGVKKAQDENKTDAIISPGVNSCDNVGSSSKEMIKDVTFDVAVTIGKEKGTFGKIGVLSGIISLKAGGESKAGETQVNRLTFSVPLILPCVDPKSK
jgi:hypothetical protein